MASSSSYTRPLAALLLLLTALTAHALPQGTSPSGLIPLDDLPAAPTSTPPFANDSNDSNDKETNIEVVIGIAVGGLIMVLIISMIICCCCGHSIAKKIQRRMGHGQRGTQLAPPRLIGVYEPHRVTTPGGVGGVERPQEPLPAYRPRGTMLDVGGVEMRGVEPPPEYKEREDEVGAGRPVAGEMVGREDTAVPPVDARQH